MTKRKSKKIVFQESINSINHQVYVDMSNSHIRMFNIINNYGTNYFTYLLGFMSSLLIQETFNILSSPVKDNPIMFVFSMINEVLLIVICSVGIKFVIILEDTQDLFLGKNNAEKVNYFLEYYKEFFRKPIQRLNIRFNIIVVCIIVMFLVNTIKFSFINDLLCGILPVEEQSVTEDVSMFSTIQ